MSPPPAARSVRAARTISQASRRGRGLSRTMRTMNRLALHACVAVSLFFLLEGEAHACSCAVPEPAAARDAAGIVFEGVLLRHEAAADGGSAMATFRVERVWRGEVRATVTVRTPGLQSMCPPHFEVGQRYIVYADGSPESASVHQCARYGFGRNLSSERAALGRPTRTFPER